MQECMRIFILTVYVCLGTLLGTFYSWYLRHTSTQCFDKLFSLLHYLIITSIILQSLIEQSDIYHI